AIVLQARLRQALQRAGDRRRLEPARRQLALEFPAAVLTTRERVEGGLARRARHCFAQASASSEASSTSSSTLFAGRVIACARIARSSSSAMSRFSFRNWRTLSLPWPSRSPL